jgi:hypothetical protein
MTDKLVAALLHHLEERPQLAAVHNTQPWYGTPLEIIPAILEPHLLYSPHENDER